MIYTKLIVHLSLDVKPFEKVNFFERIEVNETGELLARGFYFNDPATKPEGLGPFNNIQESVDAYLLMLENTRNQKEGELIRVDFRTKRRLNAPVKKPMPTGGDCA